MKKNHFILISLVLAFILSTVVLVGCQKQTVIATFKEITSDGSNKATISLTFLDDKRYEEKYYDILIKSSEEDVNLGVTPEFKDKKEIKIEKGDYWYSLTTLFDKAVNKEESEQFSTFKEAVNQTYIINSDKETTLSFKVVSGDIFKNSKETGYLLANQEDVSKVFKLEVKSE